VWRRLRWAALVAGGLTAVVGALHLPAARPLLGALGMGCPVRKVSAEQVDAVRRPALRALQGAAPASRRPALGLVLGSMREGDVRGWVQRAGLSCADGGRGMRVLLCRDVPPSALGLAADDGPVDDLALAFDSGGSLVAVDALRRGLSADAAAGAGAAIERRLTAALGPPAEAAGEWSAGHLGGGPCATSLLRYRFRNYLAFVTATQVPGQGVLLREQYMSVEPS